MKLKTRIFTIALGLISSTSLLMAEEGHKHVSGSAGSVSWGFEGAKELINHHPLFTHFPIALLLASLGFYLMGLVFKKEHFLKSGQWTLYLGTLSAAVAVWTGLQAADTVSHAGSSHQLMMTHQYLGITVLALSVLLSLWLILSKSHIPKAKPVFIGGLVLVAVLILQQVDFGGRLVFFHGVGMGRKSVVEKNQAMHHESDGHTGHSH